MHVELARLPDELAELIAGLAPGGSVVFTRGGEPVATLTAAGSAPLEGRVIPAPSTSADHERDNDEPRRPAPHHENVTVVATAMKLSDTARTKLSSELGADYIVLDTDSAPNTADILLVPPISPQLLSTLRETFPSARVVVAELEDPELGISYRGPVRRLIDSGAEFYLTSATVPRLARQLGEVATSRAELTAGDRSWSRDRLELE